MTFAAGRARDSSGATVMAPSLGRWFSRSTGWGWSTPPGGHPLWRDLSDLIEREGEGT